MIVINIKRISTIKIANIIVISIIWMMKLIKINIMQTDKKIKYCRVSLVKFKFKSKFKISRIGSSNFHFLSIFIL